MIFNILVLFFVLSSCTVVREGECLLDRNQNLTSEIYLSNQYFLAELPYWAQYSEFSRCRFDHSLRFINMKKVQSSFNMSSRR